MGKTTKVKLGNDWVEGEEVPVERSHEEWSSHVLADGTSLRLKPIVLQVVKLPGRYDTDGNPVYVVRSHVILAVDSPERKPPEQE
jgi:hypothetical protein